MSRSLRTLARLCTLAVLAGLVDRSALREAQPADRPNIVLLMADDLGYGDTGYNGHAVLKTPHLDSMAAGGMRFDRFYAAAPACSPTRGSCLTGRHPFRYGVYWANVGHLQPQESTLAEVLRATGYATGHFGKWHLGTLTQGHSSKGARRKIEANYSRPSDHGFEEWFSTESSVPTWDPGSGGFDESTPYLHNGESVVENLDGDDSRIIMDRAIPFIRKSICDKRPFLAVIWFHAPHSPVVAGPQYMARYAGCSEDEQHYFGVVTAMDEQIGRLKAELEALNERRNTMLWFCSDNGPEMGPAGQHYQGTAGPFRGKKRSLFEGGIRVPGLLEWPAMIKPGSTDVAVSTLDLYPTILELVGAESAAQPLPLDGVSVVALLEGRQYERTAPLLCQSYGGLGSATSRGSPHLAMIETRYKLLTDLVDASDLLYDLLDDPGETRNLASQQPERVHRMRQALVAWQKSCRESQAGSDYRLPIVPVDSFPEFRIRPGKVAESRIWD